MNDELRAKVELWKQTNCVCGHPAQRHLKSPFTPRPISCGDCKCMAYTMPGEDPLEAMPGPVSFVPVLVYMPPQNRWQRLRSKFMVYVWGRVKRFFMWRWHELRSLFEPRCEVHPNKRLHKGWCVACDVDAFIREQRLRNLRGE